MLEPTLTIFFFRTDTGTEPVRNWLRDLPARVVLCETPLSYAMASILEDFNRAYAQMKLRQDEPGGFSPAESEKMLTDARQAVVAFDKVTARIHRQLKWRYNRSYQVRNLLEIAKEGKGVEVAEV